MPTALNTTDNELDIVIIILIIIVIGLIFKQVGRLAEPGSARLARWLLNQEYGNFPFVDQEQNTGT